MQNINFIILLFFVFGDLFAQNNIKVGDKSPKINISEYILNAPKDISIENKFIILEFWATWCAPCLSSVTHLNDLRDEFKNRKDLIFLSLTYEKPEKIKRTLEKIKFKTIVATDQSRKTESNFNVDEIPHTVLIDNKGTVKWIGTPNKLDSSIIEKFINGKDISLETIDLKTEKKEEIIEKVEIVNNTDIALGILKDKNTQFFFTLTNANNNDNKMSIEALDRGKYFDLNNNLKPILSKIIKKPEAQIIIPEELVEKKYNLIYKNSNAIKIDRHIENLKSNLLNSLNLVEKIELKKTDIFYLKIKNERKLDISLSQEEENRYSNNDTHLVFSNTNIEKLIKEISNYHGIVIIDETGLNKSLDFIIRKGNITELINDLDEYGLKLEKATKEIEFYNYN